MYSYNNVPIYDSNIHSCQGGFCQNNNMRNDTIYQTPTNNNDDRFIGPFLGPLLLGGVAGYALRPPYPAPFPVPAPYPTPYPIPYSNQYIPYNEPTQVYTSNSYYY